MKKGEKEKDHFRHSVRSSCVCSSRSILSKSLIVSYRNHYYRHDRHHEEDDYCYHVVTIFTLLSTAVLRTFLFDGISLAFSFISVVSLF